MVRLQPMKIAAAEALLDTEDPASFSIFSLVNQKTMTSLVSIRLPRALSLLAYNQFTGEVKGINELQQTFEQQYGPGNYVPSIFVTYWSFRAMVGAGFLMLLIGIYAVYRIMRNQVTSKMKLLALFPFVLFLPYLANTTGWLLTEMGRQPWVVYTKMKTADAVSPTLTTGLVLTSLIGSRSFMGCLWQ
jgi:cytochrome d ubiquinol oxidase subunit I